MNIKQLAIHLVEHSGDIGCQTAPELIYEHLLKELLQSTAKDAFFEGWSMGRNTTVVDGDPTHDWIDSDTWAEFNRGEFAAGEH